MWFNNYSSAENTGDEEQSGISRLTLSFITKHVSLQTADLTKAKLTNIGSERTWRQTSKHPKEQRAKPQLGMCRKSQCAQNTQSRLAYAHSTASIELWPTCPKCAGYPSMCIYSSFATFLHRYVLSSSRKDDRIAAHSFWIISRSSAWVLAVRMVRINSRSLMGAGILWEKKEICKPCTVPKGFIMVSYFCPFFFVFSFLHYNYVSRRIKKMQTASIAWLKVNLKTRGIHCTSHLIFQNVRNRNCYALS